MVFFSVLGAQAFWYEPASLTVNRYDVQPPDWPAACSGLNIAVISDLHVGAPHISLAQVEAVVADTNAAKPDLILLAGDYVIQGIVGGQFVTPEALGRVLYPLKARLGVYAVLGNHDWWLDGPRVARALIGNGISMLEDANVWIESGQCRFRLAGISDFWEGASDLSKALAGIDADDLVITFTHNPDIYPELPRRVTLAIAGHTHGGQVAFPGIGAPVVPSKYGQRFVGGVIEEPDQLYFVSTGIGTSILPVRFRVPPEVSIVGLYSR